MIICRTPVRISLGGGGTDLPSYYRQYGGFLVAGAINKYVHICCTTRFENQIRLSYSETEIVDSISKIRHRIFKEALRMTGVQNHVELVSIADVPSNSGLGSSSSFTVSVLHALHTYTGDFLTKYDIAERASRLEIDFLGQPIGKQDQYIATFGGITAFTFNMDDTVTIEPLKMHEENIEELNKNILLFYTGLQRSASEILNNQNEKTKEQDDRLVGRLHKIKEMGYKSREALVSGNLDRFGQLLHEHWLTKKGISNRISLDIIDKAYEAALELGALGGKLIGAGGGGFLMIYTAVNHRNIIRSMKEMGLRYMRYHFEFEGTKIVFDHRSVF